MYYGYAISKEYIYKIVFDDTYKASDDVKLEHRLKTISEAYMFINSKFRACFFLRPGELIYTLKQIDKDNFIFTESDKSEFDFIEKFRLNRLDYFKDSLNKLKEDLNKKEKKLNLLNKTFGKVNEEYVKDKRNKRYLLEEHIIDQLDLSGKISDLNHVIKHRKLAIRYFDRYFYKEFKSFLFYNRHVATSASTYSNTILIKNREYIFIDGMYHLFNFKYYSNNDYKFYTPKNNIDFLQYYLTKYNYFDSEIKRVKNDSNKKYCEFITNKFIQVLNSIRARLIEYEI